MYLSPLVQMKIGLETDQRRSISEHAANEMFEPDVPISLYYFGTKKVQNVSVKDFRPVNLMQKRFPTG